MRQYRSVLASRSFIEFAEANLVVLIAHNELGHEPVDGVGYDGTPAQVCPLYPGMTCREHCDAAVDVDNARGEGLTRVPFIELCPNTWLVPPSGEPQRVPEEEQFEAAKVETRVKALRKTLGPALGREAFEQVRAALDQADATLGEEDLAKTLRALAGIAAQAPKPHAALRDLVAARMAEVEERAGWALEDLRDGTEALETRRAAAERLAKGLDVEVFGRRPARLAEVRAWLAETAAPAKR